MIGTLSKPLYDCQQQLQASPLLPVVMFVICLGTLSHLQLYGQMKIRFYAPHIQDDIWLNTTQLIPHNVTYNSGNDTFTPLQTQIKAKANVGVKYADDLTRKLKKSADILQQFVRNIDTMRNITWKKVENSSLGVDYFRNINTNFTIIYATITNKYFDSVANFKEIRTFRLDVSWSEMLSFLPDVYTPVVSHPQFAGKKPYRNRLKITNDPIASLAKSGKVQKSLFAPALPPLEGVNASHVTAHFIHMIPMAAVSSNGEVTFPQLRLIPTECVYARHVHLNTNDMKFYDEVFSIAQYWGEGFYHFAIENLPRISPYLSFLHEHQNIKVHVQLDGNPAFTSDFLERLGISRDRLVHGSVGAKILYIPSGTPCGQPNIFATYLLSLYLRKTAPTTEGKNSIILIRRSKKRFFLKHKQIYQLLSKVADIFGLRLDVFGDSPLPSLEETMDLFSRATVVVAPHGAGLANLLWTKPGTVVVEGICFNTGLTTTNLCYVTLAHILGQVYLGIMPVRTQDCRWTNPQDIQEVVMFYLNRLTHRPQ